MKRLFLLISLYALGLISLAGCYPMGASLGDSPDSLKSFLLSLLTSGGIGIATAFLFEKLPYVDDLFASLERRAKRLVIMIASFAIPAAAWGVGYYFGYFEPSGDALYQVARAGFEAFAASQIAHMVVLQKRY